MTSIQNIKVDELTPVEQHGDYQVKRDDLFSIAGVRGGKVRTCWALARNATKGLVTAGSRSSPQVCIVAHIAQFLGLPCRAHVPEGKLSPDLELAKQVGAEIVQHRAGYNNVIVARANEDAVKLGWTVIPFGMECQEAVDQTKRQVQNIPVQTKRIVVPVGSAMSLAGILTGLSDRYMKTPVVGVIVGAHPGRRLDRFAPLFWPQQVTLEQDLLDDYHKPAKECNLNGLWLDPFYEAKCLPYLQPGDLLWVVGIRKSEDRT